MGPMGRRSTEPCVADGRGPILGLGNVSRQDDGFGWAVVERGAGELGRPLFDITDDGDG